MKVYAGIGFVIFFLVAAWLHGEQKFDAGYDKSTNDHNEQIANISNHMLSRSEKQIDKSRSRIDSIAATAKKQKAKDNERIRSLLAEKNEFEKYYNTAVHLDAVELIYGPIELQQPNNER